MKPASVSVQFERKVNDANYGHELISVFVTAEVDDGEDVSDVAAALWRRARDAAVEALSVSPNLAVRRSLERQGPRRPQADEM